MCVLVNCTLHSGPRGISKRAFLIFKEMMRKRIFKYGLYEVFKGIDYKFCCKKFVGWRGCAKTETFPKYRVGSVMFPFINRRVAYICKNQHNQHNHRILHITNYSCRLICSAKYSKKVASLKLFLENIVSNSVKPNL